MNAVELRDYPVGSVFVGKDRGTRLSVSVEPRPEEDGHLYWRPLLVVAADADRAVMPSLFGADLPGQSAAILASLLQDAWELARSLPEILVDGDGGAS